MSPDMNKGSNGGVHAVLRTCVQITGGIQFSSVHFDLITQENAASPIDRRFSCRSWAPLVGDGDDIITEFATINGIAQTCFSGRAKGKFLF